MNERLIAVFTVFSFLMVAAPITLSIFQTVPPLWQSDEPSRGLVYQALQAVPRVIPVRLFPYRQPRTQAVDLGSSGGDRRARHLRATQRR